MSLKLSKEELFYLSDIAWWMKGYVSAKSEADTNDFGIEHVNVLVKIVEYVDREETK